MERRPASTTADWKRFYERYRRGDARSEADLFVQVGRTVRGRPISPEEFALEIDHVVRRLQLDAQDVLFEYCCGNGLVSHALSPRVRHVIGVDFTEHLVEAARRQRGAANVEYHVGDALEPLGRFLSGHRPSKYLMGFALAHFTPEQLDTILGNVLEVSPPGSFAFLFTGIPDADRKWRFYDTPERRERYEENARRGDVFNDGIGRWWSRGEIEAVARARGLSARVEPQPEGLADYRIDALIA